MKYLFICIWSLLSFQLDAQHWQRLGNGVNSTNTARTIFSDPLLDRLLVGSDFMYIYNENDTVLGVGHGAWNGTRWDSLAHRITPVSSNFTTLPTEWFLRFQGELYACGTFITVASPGISNNHFAKLNESTMRWEPLDCPNSSNIQQLIPPLEENATHLYATGHYSSLCGLPASSAYRYDGEVFHEWEPFQQIPVSPNTYVGHIFDYQGMTYMSGYFRDPLSTAMVTFMRFNGTDWEYVPGWNTTAPIKTFQLHDGILYIGGAFRQSQNAPGNYITSFDGEQWSDMGGGVAYPPVPASGIVRDIQWFDDALWVSGLFLSAGGVPTKCVAKWNGQQWCGLPGDFLLPNGLQESTVAYMAVWRDSLYVCGAFATIDGESIRHVAQWIGGDYTTGCSEPIGTAIMDVAPVPSFRIIPNPARTMIVLDHEMSGKFDIEVIDLAGRRVLQLNAAGNSIDISHLPAGYYHLVLYDRTTHMRQTQGFVKQD